MKEARGSQKKRRMDNKKIKWEKMEDIETPPPPDKKSVRGSWRIWGIEEEEGEMTL